MTALVEGAHELRGGGAAPVALSAPGEVRRAGLGVRPSRRPGQQRQRPLGGLEPDGVGDEVFERACTERTAALRRRS